MNDAQVAMWLTIVGIVGVAAILVAVFVIFTGENDYHVMLKLGILFIVIGLGVQVVRSIHYLDHGYYPIDRYVPLWISKDIGSIILVWYFAFVHPKLKK
jgi:hypothetical protein